MSGHQQCGRCYYFEDAGIAGSGWCKNPARQTAPSNLILVRRNELACQDIWRRSLWTPINISNCAATNANNVPRLPPAVKVRPLMIVDQGSTPLPTDSTGQRKLQVFLCHASGDKPAVRVLYRAVSTRGIAPWFDEDDLLPGQRWQEEIPRAVRRSGVVLVCLTKASVTKTGYVQKDIDLALDAAEHQPEGSIFLIPLRLEECSVPDRLRHYQWGDLYSPTGLDRLVAALRVRATALGVAIPSH